MAEWIQNSSYFELLDLFDQTKSGTGSYNDRRVFSEVRKELIKRYSKHSEAYKYWLGRVYKEREKILQEGLAQFFDKLGNGGEFDTDDVEGDLKACVRNRVYDIYSKQVGQKMAQPLATRKFIEYLSRTEGNRSRIRIFPQQKVSSRLDRRNTPLSKYLGKFDRYKKRLAENLAYHAHPTKGDNKLKIDNSRITLRLVPAKAVEVFRKVAIEIVGSSDDTWKAYVGSSKVMGPKKLPQSADSMIIYVQSREREIIKPIVDFLTTNFPAKTYFRPGGPMGMFELSQGITYAESPDPKKGRSFGSTRGKESIGENLTSLFLEAMKDPKKNVFSL